MAGKKDIVEQALKLIMGGAKEAAPDLPKIIKSAPSPADYIEPGSMRYLYQHPETGSYMEIVTRPKGARSASVIGLEVPEQYRGQGVGKSLQGAVLNDFPSLMGQVSSKAAAVNAYKAGRRPISNPSATIEDIFKMIDEDSSVNLATEKNAGGRTGYQTKGRVIGDIVDQALKLVMGGAEEPAKAAIRAYHGSPHDFPAERLVQFPTGKTEYLVGQPNVLPDLPEGAKSLQDFPLGRMRMDKIGTGEGAQAYGHGLYTAEAEPTARGYRDALTDRASSFRVENVDMPKWILRGIEASPDRAAAIAKYREDFTNRLIEAQKEAEGSVQPWLASGKISSAKDILAGLDALERGASMPHTAGRMYEVNIAADPNAFLDWDKPLSEQPESVLSIARPFFSDGLPTTKQYGEIVKGSDLYDMLVQRSGGVMHSPKLDAAGIPNALPGGTKERLGQYLAKQGIPGIKYLDAGSRGAGAGTSNYVVFDDRLISIIRKYGIAGASAMLGYNLMEQLDPKQALAASMADQDYQSGRPQRSMGGNNSVSGAMNVARALYGVK